MSVETEAPFAVIGAQLEELEHRLAATVADDGAEISGMVHPLIFGGGKRLRPALVILVAHLGDADTEKMFAAAIGLELIHTATLIHDDLIDNSASRRGHPALHQERGMPIAVVLGDYYLTKGLGLVAKVGDAALDGVVAGAITEICRGEVEQIATHFDFEQSLDTYYRKIRAKTSSLLVACGAAGAVCGGLSMDQAAALSDYADNLGIAFQVADDLLDYTSEEAVLGKPAGADLREGNVTLPLLATLGDADVGPGLRRLLAEARADEAVLSQVVKLVRESSGVEQTREIAQQRAAQAKNALGVFSDSPFCDSLRDLADYVVARGH